MGEKSLAGRFFASPTAWIRIISFHAMLSFRLDCIDVERFRGFPTGYAIPAGPTDQPRCREDARCLTAFIGK